MAAWFVMLILLVGSLLAAAARIEKPSWAAGFLIISAVALSLVVMGAVFVMLTRFRPHLQGPKEYAAWLKDERRFAIGTAGGFGLREVRSVSSVRISSDESEPDDVDLPETDIPRGGSRFRTGTTSTNPKGTGRYVASIANIGGSDRVLAELRRLGFDADIYRPDWHSHQTGNGLAESTSQHAAIWIGSRVPPRVAVPAIKDVLKIWGHLCYLDLSEDHGAPPDFIHDQIFFGGATSTAKAYGLQRWSPSEIAALSEDMTLEEFHSVVRARYGRLD
jgi:hypothetical protein